MSASLLITINRGSYFFGNTALSYISHSVPDDLKNELLPWVRSELQAALNQSKGDEVAVIKADMMVSRKYLSRIGSQQSQKHTFVDNDSRTKDSQSKKSSPDQPGDESPKMAKVIPFPRVQMWR